MENLPLWLSVALVIGSLGCSALNLALRSVSRARVEELIGPDRAGPALAVLTKQLDDYLLATASLRQVLNLSLILTLTVAVADWLPAAPKTAQLSVTFVIGGLLLVVFSVGLPFVLARYAGDDLVARSLSVLAVLRLLGLPLLKLIAGVDRLFRRLAGPPQRPSPEVVERELLDLIQEGRAEGVIPEHETVMLRGILQLSDLRVGRVMTPRPDVISVSADAPPEQAARLMAERNHRRLPVFTDDLDSVVGVLHYQDVLLELLGRVPTPPAGTPTPPAGTPTPPAGTPTPPAGTPTPPRRVGDLVRPAVMVPESKTLGDLLRDFHRQRDTFAVVLDEYGGVSGLVSDTDVLKLIVGDPSTGTAANQSDKIRRVSETIVEADGRSRIDTLNEMLPEPLPTVENFSTLAGLTGSVLGYIPRTGEKFRVRHYAITVLDSDERTIRKLRLELLPSDAPADSSEEILSDNSKFAVGDSSSTGLPPSVGSPEESRH